MSPQNELISARSFKTCTEGGPGLCGLTEKHEGFTFSLTVTPGTVRSAVTSPALPDTMEAYKEEHTSAGFRVLRQVCVSHSNKHHWSARTQSASCRSAAQFACQGPSPDLTEAAALINGSKITNITPLPQEAELARAVQPSF